MKLILIAFILMNPYSVYAMQLDRQNLKLFYRDIAKGDMNAVEYTLQRYPGAITQMYKHMTPLHAAVNPHLSPEKREGITAQMVVLLIQHKAYIEEKDPLSFTPLAKAAREKNAQGVAALLAHGARVDVWDGAACMSPLAYAVENNDIETALMLLNAGADRDALIKDRYELVWREQDKTMVRVPLTSEQFLERSGSNAMKALFKNFQGPRFPSPAQKDHEEHDKPITRSVKRVRIAEDKEDPV